MRDLRAPLAAGYTWLAVVWVLLSPIPNAAHATGIYLAVYRFTHAVGTVTSLAALTLVAYLIGVMSHSVSQQILVRVSRLIGYLPRYQNPWALGESYEWVPTPESAADLRTEVYRLCSETGGRCPSGDKLLEAIMKDLALVPVRLVGKPEISEVFATYDRSRAEAEFRSDVALPLSGLAVSLGLTFDWWWLFLLAGGWVLWIQAHFARGRANSVLVQSILADRVVSPPLKLLREKNLVELTRRYQDEDQVEALD